MNIGKNVLLKKLKKGVYLMIKNLFFLIKFYRKRKIKKAIKKKEKFIY
jgi:hypothetical protein